MTSTRTSPGFTTRNSWTRSSAVRERRRAQLAEPVAHVEAARPLFLAGEPRADAGRGVHSLALPTAFSIFSAEAVSAPEVGLHPALDRDPVVDVEEERANAVVELPGNALLLLGKSHSVMSAADIELCVAGNTTSSSRRPHSAAAPLQVFDGRGRRRRAAQPNQAMAIARTHAGRRTIPIRKPVALAPAAAARLPARARPRACQNSSRSPAKTSIPPARAASSATARVGPQQSQRSDADEQERTEDPARALAGSSTASRKPPAVGAGRSARAGSGWPPGRRAPSRR